jgi:hypothetical protein
LESTGARRCRRPRRTWRRSAEEEIGEKRKDLERGEEAGKRENKMEKLHISPVLRKERQEMMGKGGSMSRGMT